MRKQQRCLKTFPTIGILLTLLVCFSLPTHVLADDGECDEEEIVGAYLAPVVVDFPPGFPIPGFDTLIVLHEDGTVESDFGFNFAESDLSTGFGVWKRIDDGDDDGDDEGCRVKIRFLAFQTNEGITGFPTIPDGFPLITGRITYTVEFDPDFQEFEGPFTNEIFCSNVAFCGFLQDSLDPAGIPLVTITGTVTGRRISIDGSENDE